MKPEIILSVCIPTYNRHDFIKNNLKELLKWDYNFEIVVCDNSENSLTRDVVRDFSDDRVKYYQNNTNLGIVKNVIKSLEKSEGKYTILVSDEDTLNIINIFEIIENYDNDDVGLMLGNVVDCDGSISVKYRHSIFFSSFLSYYKYTYRTTNISGFIFNRSKIPFEKINYELKIERNGMLNYFPHNFIANHLLSLYTSVTSPKTIVTMGKRGLDQIELTENEPFYSPSNVLKTLDSRLEFIVEELNYNKYFKFLLILKEFKASLYSLLSTKNMQKHYYNKPYFDKIKNSNEFNLIQTNGLYKYEIKLIEIVKRRVKLTGLNLHHSVKLIYIVNKCYFLAHEKLNLLLIK